MSKISIYIAILSLLVSSILFVRSYTNDDKIAYVDINKVLSGYKRTALIQKDFKQKSLEFKSNSDSLLSDWQEELKEYERERNSMSETELKLKEEVLNKKQNQINNFQQAIQKKIQKDDKDNMQTLLNDINEFLKVYGEENDYRIILGANGRGNIMYAENSTDITEKVLNALNDNFEGV